MTRRRVGQCLLLACATWLAAVPLPRGMVERVYSVGWYPHIQTVLTGWSDLVPWALLDVWLLVGSVAGTWAVWRVFRAQPGRPASRIRTAVRIGWGSAVAAAALFLVFLLCWGFNYQRQPLEQRLAFDDSRVTGPKVLALAERATEALNAYYRDAYATPWPDWKALPHVMTPAFHQATAIIDLRWNPVAGQPKPTVLAPYFRWAGIAGLTNPFGLEVLPSPDALPFERPGVMAHEWAHLAGFAHEAEAGLVGWLTCMHANPQAAYSGWFSVWPSLVAAVPATDRTRLLEQLSEGPRADWQAVIERNTHAIGAVRTIAWRGYDAYLRSQRVQEGVASYGGVVRLLAGADPAIVDSLPLPSR
ncbi:MAG: DUF3810 family protein [Vicinamibacterales bacterium]